MTKESLIPKFLMTKGVSFGLRPSGFFSHSSLVIRHSGHSPSLRSPSHPGVLEPHFDHVLRDVNVPAIDQDRLFHEGLDALEVEVPEDIPLRHDEHGRCALDG